jgi:hypothetical protein
MRPEPFDELRTALVEACDGALRQAQGAVGEFRAQWADSRRSGRIQRAALASSAAIDVDDLTGDIAGLFLAQEARDGSDILWLSDPT